MATSQFHSISLAQESIRAFRVLLLASPCPSYRSFRHSQSMAAVASKPRLPCLSSQCSSGHGLLRPTCLLLPLRTFSAIGASPRSRKAADIQNPREEIRKLDEEIRKLERERRSVGKGKNAGPLGASGKAAFGGRKGNAGDNASKGKPAPGIGNAKFAASSGSSRNANKRAMARYAQDEEDEGENITDDDDDDDIISGEDDEELGDDFSSDAEMFMETTDAEEEGVTEAGRPTDSVSENSSFASTETLVLNPSETAGPIPEASIAENVSAQGVLAGGVLGTKHPWKEWNDFYDVLVQKNYFKDVPPSKFSFEGEGYLRFQASTHMKHAILEFSRERDDIIRFLTKKHIKTVVSVGCPSTDRKVVNASKRLRVLCEIPEDEVCLQCKLKTFCTRAFAAPSPDLVAETVDVARVLYSFALNASPNAESQVSYPNNVVKSVCHLIDEIVQLSAYPKDPGLPPLKSRLPVKLQVLEKDEVDGNHRPGDWTCPDCNFLNFSKNRECRECGTFRESAKQLEPGDWECPECTFVNFRRNRECRECLTPRPQGMVEAGAGGENMRPGDWKCPKCQFVNFRRNTDCRKCSTRRPKDIEYHDEEDYEPGDWKCPECKFRNFQRNKNCRECGALSPVQGRKDDRWGLKKASAASDGGWGSKRSLPVAGTEGDKSSCRPKYEEWKPELNKAVSDDSDEDLEENADVVFGRHNADEDSPMVHKGSKSKASISHRSPTDELSLSEFDLSDLDDHPKKSKKKSSRDEDEDDNDVEDDDNDMLDELSEDEETIPRGAPKGALFKGKSFSKKWDDSASGDEDLSDDDQIASRAALKRTPVKKKALSRKWDDSDDEEDEDFSDGEDDFRRQRGRGQGFHRGPRGRDSGGNRGQRGGGVGSYRGSQRGGSFGSSRGGERGDVYRMGGRGRHGSKFSQSSGDEEEFSRGAGRRRARGVFSQGGGRSVSFSESSNEDEEYSRGGGGRGGRGGGQRRGGGFSRGGGRAGFEGGRGRGGSGRQGGRGKQRGRS